MPNVRKAGKVSIVFWVPNEAFRLDVKKACSRYRGATVSDVMIALCRELIADKKTTVRPSFKRELKAVLEEKTG